MGDNMDIRGSDIRTIQYEKTIEEIGGPDKLVSKAAVLKVDVDAWAKTFQIDVVAAQYEDVEGRVRWYGMPDNDVIQAHIDAVVAQFVALGFEDVDGDADVDCGFEPCDS